MRKKDRLELEFLSKLIAVLEKQGNIDISFCMACFENIGNSWLYNKFLFLYKKDKNIEIIFQNIEMLKDGSESINVKIIFKNCFNDRTWNFSFREQLLLLGYCKCSEDDYEYNKEKECCGITCDWVRPIMKIVNLNQRELEFIYWNRTQREYWKFEEEFRKEKEKNEKSL